MTKRKNRRPGSAIDPGTIIAVLLLPAVFLGMYLFLNPGRAGEFSFYSGPVLPLSSLSGGEHVTVRRDVTLDFGIYLKEKEYSSASERVGVTDTYTLTNAANDTASVELVWGFETRFSGEMPTITVDGEPAEAAVWAAVDTDGKVRSAGSFSAYRNARTENDFLGTAMAEAPVWDVPVKVYHFYNMAYEGEEANPPSLDISYSYGKTTNLWVRTYSTTGYDRESHHLTFSTGEDAWIYVIGDDLVDMSVCGSRVHTQGIFQATEVEGLTYELEIYESTFMECLWEAARDYVYDWEEDPGPGVELVTPEMLYDGVMKRIVDSVYQQPGGVRSMDSLFGGIYSGTGMIYWVFPVEIPAGGSVTVSGTYVKESSWNSANQRHGYDVATTLGSSLNIPEQTVTLVNAQLITIVRDGESQNFGFDLENGVTTVTLDPATERYFLDVIKAE